MPPLTTFGPGSVVNVVEQMEMLSMVEPQNTPLLSTLSSERAASMNPEWYVDSLKGINYEPQIEGQDTEVFNNKGANRGMLNNRMQGFGKNEGSWQVTPEQQAVRQAGGISSEIGHAKAKALIETKIDIDACIGSDQEATGIGLPASSQRSDDPEPHRATQRLRVGEGAKLRGMGQWLKTTDRSSDGSGHAAESNQLLAPAASTGVTEEELGDVIQAIYENNGNASQTLMGIVGPALQKAISRALTRDQSSSTSTRFQLNHDAKTYSVPMKIVEFMTDFGTLNLMPSVYLGVDSDGNRTDSKARNRGYLFPKGEASLKTLIPLSHLDVDDKGGGDRGFWKASLTLCVNNVRNFGKIVANGESV